MAEPSGKCATGCAIARQKQEASTCSEYCAEAEKSGVLEIGCGCEHPSCHG